MRSRCRICEFWREASRRGVYPHEFDKYVAEGKPPQFLQAYLIAKGCQTSKKTLSRHIKECLSEEIKGQRSFEKAHDSLINRISRGSRNIYDRVWETLISRDENLEKRKCPHLHTELRMNLETEQVQRICLDCHEWVSKVSFDPEDGEKRRLKGTEKDWLLYQALRRR